MLRQGSNPLVQTMEKKQILKPRTKMQLRLTSAPASPRPTARILRFPESRSFADTLPPRHAPERMLLVEFEGLTAAEQQQAVSTFPGGTRFVLNGSALR